VISFNDVVEDISDVQRTLSSCHQRLNREGLLALNLPSSDGAFYSLSKTSSKIGFSSFFERLWQKGFLSPHLHYFNLLNIIRLLGTKEGFDVMITGSLSMIRLNNLDARISYSKNLGRTVCVLYTLS